MHDIEIYDTHNCETITVVKGVPGESIVDACQKVAAKRGWLWIGATEYGFIYAIDENAQREWARLRTNDEAVIIAELAELIEHVRTGVLDDAVGLFMLYESETAEEEWDEEDEG